MRRSKLTRIQRAQQSEQKCKRRPNVTSRVAYKEFGRRIVEDKLKRNGTCQDSSMPAIYFIEFNRAKFFAHVAVHDLRAISYATSRRHIRTTSHRPELRGGMG